MIQLAYRRLCVVGIVGSLSLGLAGCGGSDDGGVKVPPLGEVTGTVTLDDSPLPNATVEFFPAVGHIASGTTDDAGIYKLNYDATRPGAPVGESTVRISTGTGAAAAGSTEKLPAKYNTKSELKANVEAGKNSIDFPLNSK